MNLQPSRTTCSFLSQLLFGLSTLSLAAIFVMPVHVALADADAEFTVANGEFSLAAPAGWKQVQPRSRIVENEFAIEPVKPDDQPGRMTSMGAGGSIEANIARWYGQFSQPDGSSTKDKAGLKTLNIAGCKVTEGLVVRNGKARVIRDGEVFFEGMINSLKRHKDDAKEVNDGLECGIGVEGVKKFLEGDIIEVYEIKEIKRKLDLA